MKYKAILADEDELKERHEIKLGKNTKRLLFWGLFILFINLLAVIFTNLSREVYYWDNAITYNIATDIVKGGTTPKLIYDSIITQSFNYLSALPSALFLKLFGQGRTVFILSLVNCYLIPSYALMYKLIKKVGKAPVITASITFLLLPVLIFLSLNGFVEMGGAVMGLACFCLYFGDKKHRFVKSIFIGILLSLMTLWNTWYIFFAVSFITAMLAECILSKKPWYMSVVTLLTLIGILAGCFEGFVFTQLFGAYGKGSFDFLVRDNLHMLSRYFGLILLVFVIADSIVIFIKEHDKTVIFPWVQIAVCYLTFTATKLHSQSHTLMYVPAIVLLLAVCIKHIKKEKMLLAIMLLAIIQPINTLLPWQQPNGIEEIKRCTLLNSFSLRTKKRDDIEELLKLKAMLDGRVSDGEYLGVLSYSDSMNDELLRGLEPSLNIKNPKTDYIARTIPYFDSPDLDISPLCNASYMLTATPLQTVAPNQIIVATALESFDLYCDIAAAYEEQFDAQTTINGVTYKLYKRVREVTATERAEFTYRYKAYLNN